MVSEVVKVLENIDVNKAHGPDDIPGNSSELNYQIPHPKQNYLKHSFYYRSINFWNKLPMDIKSVDSFHTFKRRL